MAREVQPEFDALTSPAVTIRDYRRLWAEATPPARALLLGSVAALFAAVGLLADVLAGPNDLALRPFVIALISGSTAALLLWVLVTRLRWLPAVLGLLVVSLVAVDRFLPPTQIPGSSMVSNAIGRRVALHLGGAIAGIALGFSGVAIFLTRGGRRYVQLETELAIARDIHRLLVPAIEARIGLVEVVGMSRPSGDVGGDLIDFSAGADGAWTAYVADVSGHGVGAGVLMGMTKSAMRMALSAPGGLGDVIERLNNVLTAVSPSHMFATCAAVRCDADGTMEAILAGHLPILHYHHATGTVTELGAGHIALGFVPDRRFEAVTFACRAGDLLALLTDGFTEVFDAHDREIGLSGVRNALLACAREDLRHIPAHLVDVVRRHGSQTDDQSCLLIRFHTNGEG